MNENSSPNSGQNNRGPRNHQRGGRRNDSRGPRRDGRDGQNNHRSEGGRPPRERSNYGTRENPPTKPLTFWQKIVAFFSGKPTTPVAPAPASVHPTVRAERERQENQRSERQRTENQRHADARPESNRSNSGRPSDSYRRTETRPQRNAGDASETNEPSDTGTASEPTTAREPRAPREERAPRVVEIVEVTSSKLYVGNLSFDAAESDLFDLFNGVGKVRNAEVVSNNYTQKSKGFAFVTMETIDEAKRAVVELHDKEFMGRKLLVSGAKTNDRSEA